MTGTASVPGLGLISSRLGLISIMGWPSRLDGMCPLVWVFLVEPLLSCVETLGETFGWARAGEGDDEVVVELWLLLLLLLLLLLMLLLWDSDALLLVAATATAVDVGAMVGLG